jgi:hypothetical protein
MIRVHHPHLDILVGGQAFRRGGTDAVKKYPGVIYISSLQELESLIARAGSDAERKN